MVSKCRATYQQNSQLLTGEHQTEVFPSHELFMTTWHPYCIRGFLQDCKVIIWSKDESVGGKWNSVVSLELVRSLIFPAACV